MSVVLYIFIYSISTRWNKGVKNTLFFSLYHKKNLFWKKLELLPLRHYSMFLRPHAQDNRLIGSISLRLCTQMCTAAWRHRRHNIYEEETLIRFERARNVLINRILYDPGPNPHPRSWHRQSSKQRPISVTFIRLYEAWRETVDKVVNRARSQ